MSYRVRAGLIASTLALAACRESGANRTATMDSALSRDLTLAASATPDVAIGDTAMASTAAPAPTPASPSVRKSPGIKAPSTRQIKSTSSKNSPKSAPSQTGASASAAASAPAPAPLPAPAPTPAEAPAPAPRARALAAGTALTGTTNSPICSLTQRPGDRFVVTLGNSVTGPDGAVLPQGSPVLVELARVDSAAGEFAFRLKGVQVQGDFIPADGTVRVSEAAVTERKVSKGGSDQGKVVTGAIIGGILGRVIGGGARGAVIGAAGGAAAGTVAAARNTSIERCMAAGATLTATLGAPLTLPPAP